MEGPKKIPDHHVSSGPATLDEEVIADYQGEAPDVTLLKCKEALQATIDALAELQTLDQIVPRVLQIVANHFKAPSCCFYESGPSGEGFLRYWHFGGRTMLPDELLGLDAEKFALIRSLSEGCMPPASYLGKPINEVFGPVLLNHANGTSMPEFDRFAVSFGWDLELNIGVAAGGFRASSLCIYRGLSNPFSRSEIALAECLAKQLGLAMQSVRLAEQAREAAVAKDREAQAKRVSEFLVRTGTGLSNSDDLPAALGSLLTALAESIDAAHLFLFRHDPALNTLRLHLAYIDGDVRPGLSGSEMPLFANSFPADITPAWRIMCEYRKLFTPALCPIPAEEFGWPGALEYAHRFGLSDVAHIVLFAGETAVGSIGFGFRGGAKLRPTDVPFIEAVAQQTAVVIRMLDLSEEVRLAAIVREKAEAAEQRAMAFARSTAALQSTIDALGESKDLDRIVPRVLGIVAETFGGTGCALFENQATGMVHLRYWHVDGKTLTPSELLQLDAKKFALVRRLAEGFEVPDSYLGGPANKAIGPVLLDHVSGTAVPEFDEFAVGAGWDLELNIGVAAGGVRATSLVIFRGRTRPFLPDEISLAESLATQLGLAVQFARQAEDARLAAISREQEEAARTRVAELAGANKVLRTTLGRFAINSDTGTFLSSILEETVQQIGADGAQLALYDESTHTMRTAAGYFDGRLQDFPFAPVISASDLGGFDVLTSMAGPLFFNLETEPHLFWPGTLEFHRSRGSKSVFCVSMHLGARFTGFLGFSFRGPVELSPERVELVQALAQQATLVAELLRLSDTERQAAIAREREEAAESRASEARRISDFLNATLGRLTDGDDPGRTVEWILSGLAQELGARYVFLFRHNLQERTLRLDLTCIDGSIRHGSSGEEVPLFATSFPDDITPAWQFMVELRSLFTPNMVPPGVDNFAWPGSYECAARLRFSDMGHIVLFAGDQPVGSIWIGLCDGRVLKPADKAFIEGIAKQAAIAIRMSELAEAAKIAAVAREREAAAQERVVKLAKTNSALKQTLDVVAFEPDFQQVPGRVLEAITTQLGSPSSALWLFDKSRGRFEVTLVYHKGKVMEVNARTLAKFNGAWGQGRDLFLKDHARERRPLVYQVKDLEASDAQAFAFFKKLGIRTLLGVPLLLGTEVLGSLTIRFDTLRELAPEELELTQAMAHQATLAIQLTRLAERVGEVAISEERARFARDIHDTLAQGFTGILMQLGAASQVPGDQRSDIATHLQTIASLARANLAEARRSVRALRPVSYSECRLDTTVEQFVETARLQTRADVSLQVRGERGQLAPHVENELCRMVQESLNNAVRHAAAKKISVGIEFQSTDAVRLSVKDDGVGFDTALRPAADSFGLIGMQERAASIGASLTVISDKHRGAEIIIQYGKATF